MFLSYEQVATTNVAQTATALVIPTNAMGAMLQAETQDCRYTMDDATDPTQTTGMILRAQVNPFDGDDPKEFLIEDLRRIRFCRGAGANGLLNLHYFAARDI